jgi:hypothetical protein
MTHTIQFNTAAELIKWLFENNIDELPVELTIKLGE